MALEQGLLIPVPAETRQVAPVPSAGYSETSGRDEKPGRVSPSEGDSWYPGVPGSSSLPIFQEKPEIHIFM